MKRLVLDLRSNPGGQLDQAIRITNRFVPKGAMVVYTRGRVPNSDQDYRATDTPEYTTIPMITLVNRSSASASEIVSARCQDVRPLADHRRDHVRQGAGAVGVSRQRRRRSGADDRALLHAERPAHSAPWDGTFDEYLTYTMKDQSQRTYSADQLKHTTGGRKVYSAAASSPTSASTGRSKDSTRRGSDGRSSTAAVRVLRRAVLSTRATRARAPRRTGFKYVKKGFEVDAVMVQDFKAFVIGKNTKMEETRGPRTSSSSRR